MLLTDSVQADCRFCSTVSKANGHDPIGSALPYDQWLIIEIPQPWEQPLPENIATTTLLFQTFQKRINA